MKKFTPYAKQSKHKQHELDRHKRGSWGGLNPVTRKPPNPKAYNRKKTQKRSRWDDSNSAPSFFYQQQVQYLLLFTAAGLMTRQLFFFKTKRILAIDKLLTMLYHI